METKLTLRLEAGTIRKAKRYSRLTGKSLSRLVADYLVQLEDGGGAEQGDGISPKVRTLLGALSGAGVTEGQYLRHLEEKHR